MRYSILFAFLLLSVYTVFSQDEPLKITSEIKSVKVFTSGAQVTRTAQLQLISGKNVVVLTGLSPQIKENSVQVTTPDFASVASVKVQLDVLSSKKERDEVKALENRLERLRKQRNDQQDLLKVYKNEESILLKNQAVAGENAGLKMVDLKAVLDYQKTQYTDNLRNQSSMNAAIKSTDSLYTLVNQQLNEVRGSSNKQIGELLVNIQSDRGGKAQITFTYFVDAAGWVPVYDLKVTDISSPVALTTKAEVYQNTNEDWKNVQLSLSSGNPTENAIAPTLQPWYVAKVRPLNSRNSLLSKKAVGLKVADRTYFGDEVQGTVYESYGQPLMGATVVTDAGAGVTTDLDGRFKIKVPKSAKSISVSFLGFETVTKGITASVMNFSLEEAAEMLESVVVSVGYGNSFDDNIEFKDKARVNEADLSVQTTTVSFDVKEPFTVLSDGNMYTANLSQQEIPASYRYFSVPKLDKAAYLNAEISDWQKYDLLPGAVNLYFEGTYLGQSFLNVEQASDTLAVSLGRDKAIVIDRVKRQDFTKKQFLSSNKTERNGFDISVKNNKKQAINIVILDQFPISTESDVVVEHAEADGAKVAPDTQEIRWELKVEPKTEVKKRMQYTVKSPKASRVVLE